MYTLVSYPALPAVTIRRRAPARPGPDTAGGRDSSLATWRFRGVTTGRPATGPQFLRREFLVFGVAKVGKE